MTEIEIGGHKYRTGRLDAIKQGLVTKRLAPLLNELRQAAQDIPELSETRPEGDTDADAAIGEKILDKLSQPLLEAIEKVSDDNYIFIVATCLAVCERASGGGWAPVMRGGNRMFQDMNMTDDLGIAFATVRENLAHFFYSDPPNSSASEVPQK